MAGKGRSSAPQRASTPRPAPKHVAASPPLSRDGGKRKLKPRGTDETIDRILYDNFSDWKASDVAGRRNEDGLNLREQLRQDLRRKRSGEHFVMGAKYYKRLRLQYGPDESAAASLQVQSPDEPVSASLKQALKAHNSSQKLRNPLLEWMDSARTCNQRELVGLLKHILGLNPCATITQAQLVHAACRFMVNVGLDERFPKEFSACMDHFDSALCLMWKYHKRENLPMHRFWDLYRPTLSKFIGSASMDLILKGAASEKWSRFEPEVLEITRHSKIGQQMLGFARVHITASGVAQYIKKVLQAKRWTPQQTLPSTNFDLNCC